MSQQKPNTVPCPNCGQDIPAGNDYCPYCGWASEERKREQAFKIRQAILGILSLFILAIGFLLGLFLFGKPWRIWSVTGILFVFLVGLAFWKRKPK